MMWASWHGQGSDFMEQFDWIRIAAEVEKPGPYAIDDDCRNGPPRAEKAWL